MVPSRVAGLLAQSSPSSGLYFQGDEHSQSVVNSYLSSPFGSSSGSLPGTRHSNKGAASEDINGVSLNSVGASSLVTDANSAFSGSPHLLRSASINNTESYNHLPTSPMSFTSNNISISSSSIMDGSSVVHHNSRHDITAQQIQKTQQQQHGNSSVTSFPQAQNGQFSLPISGQIPGSLIQDPNNFSHVQKKPRIDIKQEDILQQQVLQQLLQPDSMQMQNRNPQLHALFQQQRLRPQQQQILQSMPHLQRAHLQQQQQQQMQLRQQMQQQGIQPMNVLKRPNDSGVCARRLMQYLYHQRQRSPDNSIAYWRKFVAEYYSPRAKKRWCLSLYENVGQHALGVFPQAAMHVWQCDICNSKPGRGFEATFEVLPRLNEIKFGSGVIEELLFLDLPKEYRTPTGLMVLEHAKAVQESVYEQLRVVREGHLRIVFAQDLKILSWEFCARRHEEHLSRRLIAPQVSQLLQVAQKCNSAITEAEDAGVSSQDLQTSSNMVQPAWRQLAKTIELQSLNDLGFSKRYVRCLQISEVVNSMKDLVDFCRDQKSGPVDGLKNYPRHASTAKSQMQEMEQPLNVQDIHPNSVVSNNNHIINRGAISGTPHPQASIALTSYQNMLMRQNSMNPTQSSSPNNSLQQETPCFSNKSASNMKQLGNHVSGYSSPQLPPDHPAQQQLQEQRGAANNLFGAHQHQMIRQLFQEMSNNGGSRGTGTGSGTGHQHQNNSPQPSTSNVSGGTVSRNNSFKEAVASNGDSSRPAAGGTNRFNSRTHDLPLPQSDILSDIIQEFTDSGFFSADFDDVIMGFN